MSDSTPCVPAGYNWTAVPTIPVTINAANKSDNHHRKRSPLGRLSRRTRSHITLEGTTTVLGGGLSRYNNATTNAVANTVSNAGTRGSAKAFIAIILRRATP